MVNGRKILPKFYHTLPKFYHRFSEIYVKFLLGEFNHGLGLFFAKEKRNIDDLVYTGCEQFQSLNVKSSDDEFLFDPTEGDNNGGDDDIDIEDDEIPNTIDSIIADTSDDQNVMSESNHDTENPSSEDDNQTSHEDFINYLETAKNYLKYILECRNTPKNEINQSITCFNRYIDKEEDMFNEIKTDENSYSWMQIRLAFQGFDIIADIAMRLLACATGEASCERTIKRQRLIQTSRRINSHKTLLDARMILTTE